MNRVGYINVAIDTFYLQLFFVSLLFCRGLEKRKHFLLRLLPPFCVCLVFFFLYPTIPLGFLNLSFTLIFFANSLIMLWAFQVKWKQIMFYDAVAGTMQNLVAKFITILSLFGWLEERTISQLAISTLLFAGAVTIFYLMFIRETKENYVFTISNVRFAVLLAVSALVLLVYSPFADWYFKEPYARAFLCVNFITIDLVVLFMAFGIFEKNSLENEKEIIGRLLHLQRGQMQQAEENVNLINRKCHDMLRTLELMEAGALSSEKAKYAAELKDTIHQYDIECQTGNRVLDVILTKYGMLCGEKRIQFTYMVDGKALDFVDDCDLYSFFGNALDNAIEALAKEKDEQKRILEVICRKKDNFVIVEVENYFTGSLVFSDDLPVTTKKNDGYHGYGIKSMRYVMEKYGGNLHVGKEDGFFVVRAMFCL